MGLVDVGCVRGAVSGYRSGYGTPHGGRPGRRESRGRIIGKPRLRGANRIRESSVNGVESQLERGTLCWLVTGDASVLVDRAVHQLTAWGKARCGPPSFNFSTVYGSDPNAVGALASARTLPMMAPLRVVVLRELDQADDATLAAIAAYLEDPSPSTLFVACGAGFPKVRKGGSNWSAKIAPLIKKSGVHLKFGAEDVQPATFIREHASTLGKELSRADAELLVALVGRDLGPLVRELEKVALYVGDSPRIDADAIHAACSLLAEAEVWSLTAAIASRDAGAAWLSLQRLLDGGDAPHRLLGLVVWQLRQALQVIELARAGRSEREIRELVKGVRGEALSKILANAQSTAGSAALLESVARCNRAMNSHRAGDRHVFEAFVLEICR